MNSFWELGMIVCFGLSWPFNLVKSIRSKSTKGKSLVFLIAIFVGYVCGIIHKFTHSLDWVTLVYGFNLLMVSADLALYVVNRRREVRDGGR